MTRAVLRILLQLVRGASLMVGRLSHGWCLLAAKQYDRIYGHCDSVKGWVPMFVTASNLELEFGAIV